MNYTINARPRFDWSAFVRPQPILQLVYTLTLPRVVNRLTQLWNLTSQLCETALNYVLSLNTSADNLAGISLHSAESGKLADTIVEPRFTIVSSSVSPYDRNTAFTYQLVDCSLQQ